MKPWKVKYSEEYFKKVLNSLCIHKSILNIFLFFKADRKIGVSKQKTSFKQWYFWWFFQSSFCTPGNPDDFWIIFWHSHNNKLDVKFYRVPNKHFWVGRSTRCKACLDLSWNRLMPGFSCFDLTDFFQFFDHLRR